MRNMKGTIFVGLITILVAVLLPAITFAQINPGCDPLCNCYPDGTLCPFDGGLSVLLVAGVGYGIKRVRDSRKNIHTHGDK
jgi:hypothetical protein